MFYLNVFTVWCLYFTGLTAEFSLKAFRDVLSFVCILQVLQNLGKADRTTDDVFNEHASNFKRQEVSGAI